MNDSLNRTLATYRRVGRHLPIEESFMGLEVGKGQLEGTEGSGSQVRMAHLLERSVIFLQFNTIF